MRNRSARNFLIQSLLLASALAAGGCASPNGRSAESNPAEKASESVFEDAPAESESALEEETEAGTEREVPFAGAETETEVHRRLNRAAVRKRLQQLKLRYGEDATFAWSFSGQLSIREPRQGHFFTDFPLSSFYTIPGYEVSPPENSMQILRVSLIDMLSAFDGDWSVYVKNLNTGETMSINDTAMPSASIMKLFVMGTVYRAIETGDLQRTDQLMSLLTDMISYSSNEDANTLISILGDGSYAAGIAKVNEYIRSEGYSEKTHQYNGFQNESTVVDPEHFNHLCASDCGMLIEKVYHRTFGTRKVCNEIESMMLNQQTRYKIPAAIGDRAQVGNKTGETDNTENDVAIVYTSSCDYIICILSSNWASKDQAQHRIQAVSGEVFSYFTDPDFVTKHFRYSKEFNPRAILAADKPEEETESSYEELTEAETESSYEELTEAETEPSYEELTEAETAILSVEEKDTEGSTEEISETITKETSKDILKNISEDISEDITEGISEEAAEGITEDISEALSESPAGADSPSRAETLADDKSRIGSRGTAAGNSSSAAYRTGSTETGKKYRSTERKTEKP